MIGIGKENASILTHSYIKLYDCLSTILVSSRFPAQIWLEIAVSSIPMTIGYDLTFIGNDQLS